MTVDHIGKHTIPGNLCSPLLEKSGNFMLSGKWSPWYVVNVSLIVGFGRWPMQWREAQGDEFQATASNQVCHQVSTWCKERCCTQSMGEGWGGQAVGWDDLGQENCCSWTGLHLPILHLPFI